MKIQIINGPNLNLLGVREPGIYGSNSFESYLPKLKAKYPEVEIEYYQSNIEGELINKLQGSRLHLRWRSAQCGCLHPHQHCLAGLHPQHEMPLRRGTYLQCAQARGIPPSLLHLLRLPGSHLWIRSGFLRPCHRRYLITKGKRRVR